MKQAKTGQSNAFRGCLWGMFFSIPLWTLTFIAGYGVGKAIQWIERVL